MPAVSVAELLLLLKAKDESSKEVDKARKGIVSFGKDVQKAGAIMTAAVTGPLVLFGKAAIDTASSTEESMSKVRVVFGQAAGEIERFAETSATSLGISRQSALESAGTFGNLFSAFGIGKKESAEMSVELVKLAADLASFNNMDPTEVLDKLRAGLSGQSEPLRSVGVALSVARIEAEAFAIGLVKPVSNQAAITKAHLAVAEATRAVVKETKEHGAASLEAQKARNALELAEQDMQKALAGTVPELTQAQKTQAAYSLIMKDTALAQGDFSRTADGLANSTRIATAMFDDLKGELGRELLPIALEVVGVVKDMLGAFKSLDPEVRKNIVVVAGLLAVVGPLLGLLGTIITIAPAVGLAFTLMTGPIGLAVLAVAAIVTAVVLVITRFEDLKASFSALVGILGVLAGRFMEVGRGVIEGIWRGIQGAWDWLVRNVTGALGGLLDSAKRFLGISSPSEVFARQVGSPIVLGVADGIARTAPVPLRVMNDVLDATMTVAENKRALFGTAGEGLGLALAKGIDTKLAEAAQAAERRAIELAGRLSSLFSNITEQTASSVGGGGNLIPGKGAVHSYKKPDGTMGIVQVTPEGEVIRDGVSSGRVPAGQMPRAWLDVGGMPTPVFHQGGVMPWTGMAMLEKGERVLTKDQQRGNMGLTVIFQGPVYGMLDFEQTVKRIVRDAYPQVALR